jgi:hypothetical protein
MSPNLTHGSHYSLRCQSNTLVVVSTGAADTSSSMYQLSIPRISFFAQTNLLRFSAALSQGPVPGPLRVHKWEVAVRWFLMSLSTKLAETY